MTNYSYKYHVCFSREMRKNYYVEIQTTKDGKMVEFYLWKENYGIKMLMFGLDLEKKTREFRNIPFFEKKEQTTIPWLLNTIVEDNIDTYIEIYKEDYEDEKQSNNN